MKKSFISQLITDYDLRKGIKKIILGDDPQIIPIKQFLNTLPPHLDPQHDLSREQIFRLAKIVVTNSLPHIAYEKIKHAFINQYGHSFWVAVKALQSAKPTLMTFANFNDLFNETLHNKYHWISCLSQNDLLNQDNFNISLGITYIGVDLLMALSRAGLLKQNQANFDKFCLLDRGKHVKLLNLILMLSHINYLNQDTFNLILKNLRFAIAISNLAGFHYVLNHGCFLEYGEPDPSHHDTRKLYVYEKDGLIQYVFNNGLPIKINSLLGNRADAIAENIRKVGGEKYLSSEDRKYLLTVLKNEVPTLNEGLTVEKFNAIFVTLPAIVQEEVSHFLIKIAKKSASKCEETIEAAHIDGLFFILNHISQPIIDKMFTVLSSLVVYPNGKDDHHFLDLVIDGAECVDISHLCAKKIKLLADTEVSNEPSFIASLLGRVNLNR